MVNVVDIESPWLDNKGLSKYLGGVSDEWIRKMVISDLHVHVRRIGKKFFYRKSEIDRFVERHTLV